MNKYEKPSIIDRKRGLPPITLNFSAPAVGNNNATKHSEEMAEYKEQISSMIEDTLGMSPNFEDKKISESAKQI